jgi:hypothetical protein
MEPNLFLFLVAVLIGTVGTAFAGQGPAVSQIKAEIARLQESRKQKPIF